MNTTRTRSGGGFALAALALAAAGCSGHAPGGTTPSRYATPNPSLALSAQPLPTTSPAPYPVPLPSASEVDRGDPTATARAAVVTMWSTDMASDASQYQANLRAAWLLAPAYLASIQAHPPVGAPGAWWNECAEHHAYTTVAATADHEDQPADTATSADRQFSITITPHGAGGWTGPSESETVFISLTRPAAGQPWAVAGVEVSD
jgi:hypothetical protein